MALELGYKLKRIKELSIRRYFHWATRGIFKTGQLDQFDEQSNVVLLSMLQPADVQMYLLALKSFTQYIRPNKVVIVCDPKLTEPYRDILRQQVSRIEFINAADMRSAHTPQGGCWERFMGIASLNQDYYVIQLDADTLTIAPPNEVLQAIAQQQGFLLATEDYERFMTLDEIAADSQRKKEGGLTHIQVESEILLPTLADKGYHRYVRACAGFAGFAPGTVTPEKVYQFSAHYRSHLGERWAEWGSEQFASNVILSNSDPVGILPLAKYDSSDCVKPTSVFLHFIGYVRFVNFEYVRYAKQIIRQLTH